MSAYSPTLQDQQSVDLVNHGLSPLVDMSARNLAFRQQQVLRQMQLQDEYRKLAQEYGFRTQLQQSQLAGLQANELALQAAREKVAQTALAARNESIKPAVTQMQQTENQLRALLRADETRRVSAAQNVALDAVLSSMPDVAKVLKANPKLSFDQAISKLDPKTQTAATTAYRQEQALLLSNPKWNLDESTEAQKAALQTRLRYFDEILMNHVRSGGTLPTAPDAQDYLGPAAPAQTRLQLPPPGAGASGGEFYGPPPPPSPQNFPGIATPIAGLIGAAGQAIGNTAVPLLKSAAENAKAILFGGQLKGMDQTFSPAQQEMIGKSFTPGNELGDVPQWYFAPKPASPAQPVVVAAPPELAPPGPIPGTILSNPFTFTRPQPSFLLPTQSNTIPIPPELAPQ